MHQSQGRCRVETAVSVIDLPTGLKEPRSMVLLADEEAVIVAFRRHRLLPLDDCRYALQPTIPCLTRSFLYCCLQRHGISRKPDVERVSAVLTEPHPAFLR